MVLNDRVYPDFAHRKASEIVARLRADMVSYREEIEAIKQVPVEEVAFGNIVEALEGAGKSLELSEGLFFNLLSADADDELMSYAEELTEELSDLSNEVDMDPDLALRIKQVYEGDRSQLSEIQSRLLDKCYDAYKERGAFLPESTAKELKELRKRLSILTMRFGQNVLKEQDEYRLSILDEEAIVRIPDSIREAAHRRAIEDGVQGWIFDMSAPSYMAVMQYCQNRDIRERMYRDRNSIGIDTTRPTANVDILREIVELRRQISVLLGYESYAERVLTHRMAKSVEAVYTMLDELRDAYMPLAKSEVECVQKLATEQDELDQLMPWDWAYYAEQYRSMVLSYDEEETRPYFELSSTVQSLFGLATDLYGLTFVPNASLPSYRPDVDVYDVKDQQGALIGTLLMDYHPRKGKRSGAWMTNYVEAYGVVRPVVSLVMNFTPPSTDAPALITLDEARTLYHEFGHALHGLLTRVEYASMSGTNVWRDFVELPSQIMENWLLEPDYLHEVAKHYQTGAPIPPEMMEAIKKNNQFLEGYACIRQLNFGYLDMAWHTLPKEEVPSDIEQLEEQIGAPIALLPRVEGTAISPSFGHIFSGGYAAGYYGYKWAEILDADAFEEFQAHGLHDRATADRFRIEILERGDADDPDVLYRNFKGHDATPDALLRRSGIEL